MQKPVPMNTGPVSLEQAECRKSIVAFWFLPKITCSDAVHLEQSLGSGFPWLRSVTGLSLGCPTSTALKVRNEFGSPQNRGRFISTIWNGVPISMQFCADSCWYGLEFVNLKIGWPHVIRQPLVDSGLPLYVFPLTRLIYWATTCSVKDWYSCRNLTQCDGGI